MAHKSRLAAFVIDCKATDIAEAARFWSAALGYELRPKQEEASPLYREMLTGPDGLHLEVQQVKHDSRVHLDIESDDVDAEVRRLEALGATIVRRVHTWCVMQAPTGQRFCVVRAQSKDFAARANAWTG